MLSPQQGSQPPFAGKDQISWVICNALLNGQYIKFAKVKDPAGWMAVEVSRNGLLRPGSDVISR
jgi:hypothetical protein